MNNGYRALGIAAALLMPTVPTLADMIDTSGMAAWETCALCHSADGISPMSKFPKLAGQKQAYIKKQALDFRLGQRSNDGGQMQTITAEVELASLNDIADYFASLPPSNGATWEPNDAQQAQDYALGKQLFEKGREGLPACASCHADKRHVAPWINAQHRDYLKKQLKDFKQRERKNDAGQQMQNIANALQENEVDAVVFYLSTTPLMRD